MHILQLFVGRQPKVTPMEHAAKGMTSKVSNDCSWWCVTQKGWCGRHGNHESWDDHKCQTHRTNDFRMTYGGAGSYQILQNRSHSGRECLIPLAWAYQPIAAFLCLLKSSRFKDLVRSLRAGLPVHGKDLDGTISYTGPEVVIFVVDVFGSWTRDTW